MPDRIPNLGEPKNLKDRVISILTSEWPLSAKKIYNRVKKSGVNVTYQAVHKVIKELYLNNVFEREGKEYKLNTKWIEGVEDFGKTLKRNYENERIPTLDEIVSKGMVSIQFNTLYKCYEFLIYILHDLSKFYNKIGIAQLHHLYWALSASDEIFNQFKRMFSAYEKVYAITPSKTVVDRLIAQFYKKIAKNVEVKLGIDCAKECDIFIAGDFVIQIFYNEKIKRLLHQSYLKAKVMDALGLSKIYETVINAKAEINLIILKNPRLAEQIRNRTLAYFEK